MTTIATPEVTLIAHTTISQEGAESVPLEKWMSVQKPATDAETLIEFSGRACYESFHRPNPATAKNADYIARTLHEQGHWSIAEHATATLYFTGVSRAFTHELIRHRHLSYSQLSQRFVNESEANIVIPPALRGASVQGSVFKESMQDSLNLYGMTAELLEETGSARKQAREAARGVLPNMTETRIVVTGNLRAWHEVIERRTAPDADAEMRQVMGMARDVLEPIAPAIFGGDS